MRSQVQMELRRLLSTHLTYLPLHAYQHHRFLGFLPMYPAPAIRSDPQSSNPNVTFKPENCPPPAPPSLAINRVLRKSQVAAGGSNAKDVIVIDDDDDDDDDDDTRLNSKGRRVGRKRPRQRQDIEPSRLPINSEVTVISSDDEVTQPRQDRHPVRNAQIQMIKDQEEVCVTFGSCLDLGNYKSVTHALF